MRAFVKGFLEYFRALDRATGSSIVAAAMESIRLVLEC